LDLLDFLKANRRLSSILTSPGFKRASCTRNTRFYYDRLTLIMTLTVTVVAFLIHLYSRGYMEHEGGYYRFFTYMNLFLFMMLTLVTAASYPLMFVGWEGVGLCSYLLIGFYFTKKSASDAGKKAFIVTRIGDAGFTVGVALLFWTFHSLDFQTVFDKSRRFAPRRVRKCADGHRASPLPGRGRQIRTASLVRVAPGCDGRPHAGERLDPRRHHGDGGRLPGGQVEHHFRPCSLRP
jgi:NADH:ubiquinone oxidoreductase subunit 5 (subunit L)/multisubunit Na+/H+ antiporter MnhA subunit